MEKHQVVLLAASILMQDNDSKRNILNKDGQDSFKKHFSIYQDLLDETYELSMRKKL